MKNMKTNWPIKKLSEVCIINPKKAEVAGFADDTVVSFVPMSSVDEFSQSITLQEEKELSKVKKGYTYFKKGDILFAKITPCMENGKVAHAKNLNTDIGFGSTEFHILRAKDEVLPEYIYSLVSSSAFRVEAEKKMTGSAGQKRVPKDFIENYELVIPSIEEQRRIVDILEIRIGGTKKAIQLRQDAIADTEKILSAKLTEIFTEGKEKGWGTSELEPVCEKVADGTHDTPAYHPEGVPLITSKNLKPNGIDFENVKFISQAEHEQISKRSGVQRGDLLLAMIGTIGNITMINGDETFSIKNVGLIRPDESKVLGKYIYYFLHNSRIFDLFELRGGTQKFISLGSIRKCQIYFPDIKTQEKIVKELDALSARVAELRALQQTQLADLKSLERAYLHEAFNGELV